MRARGQWQCQFWSLTFFSPQLRLWQCEWVLKVSIPFFPFSLKGEVRRENYFQHPEVR